MSPPTVAVVGLGALGLVTLKNLLEEGFDVTGFERNEYLGGLWNYSEKANVSVLKSTVTNGSKQRGCFTDFPFPEETPDFVPAEAVHKYLIDYSEHFGLEKHARLKTKVHDARFDEKRRQWGLEISDDEHTKHIEYFDKVVFAMGTDQIPVVPNISGMEKFRGEKQHSFTFKRPEEWAGKRVLVMGFGNTAADMSTELSKTAEQVYLSHRHGAIVLPRWVNNRPVDHVRTYRKYTILQLMARYAPSLWETTLNSVIKKLQNQVFQVRPEWGFEPAPSIAGQRPLVSDDLVDCLINGTVKSTVGVDRVLDGTHVEMTDGTVIEVDAILFCTGFTVDYSVVGPDADPTRHTTKDWNRAIGSNGKWLPRLYQNIFSLDHPDSLAFMGNLSFMNPAFFMFDLGAMALAQLWSGKSRFPSIDEMNRHVDAHHQWVIEKATRGPVMPSIVKSTDWMQWVNETAGTNVDKFMGYTWLGWKMWFSDRKFCNMLMDGLLSPHLYRLFPGTKRRQWLGAEEAIITMNKDITKRFGPMD